MTVPNEQPEFDPATWTPDKPWPKGYYRPMSRVALADIRAAPRPDDPGSEESGRRFAWGVLTVASQCIGLLVAANPRPHRGFGPLFEAINRTFLFWPPLVFFTLVLPVLLYAAFGARRAMPLGKRLVYGMGSALCFLVPLLVVVLLAGLRARYGLYYGSFR